MKRETAAVHYHTKVPHPLYVRTHARTHAHTHKELKRKEKKKEGVKKKAVSLPKKKFDRNCHTFVIIIKFSCYS